MTIGEVTHEVDSIIECKGPLHGNELSFKLEMCCPCCKGRDVILSRTRLIKMANEPLRDLALQTIEFHAEGLEIAHDPK